MGNHNVSVLDLRRELSEAGFHLARVVGTEEVWLPSDAILRLRPQSQARFHVSTREVGPKNVAGVRREIEAVKRIARYNTPSAPPTAQPINRQSTVELIGPAVPEEGSVFLTTPQFRPAMPDQSPVIVISLDPLLVDVPGRRARVPVDVWAATVPPIAPMEPAVKEPVPDQPTTAPVAQPVTPIRRAELISTTQKARDQARQHKTYQQAAPGTRRQQVIDFLRTVRSATPPQVALAIKIDPHHAGELLRKGVETGHFIRVATGVYALSAREAGTTTPSTANASQEPSTVTDATVHSTAGVMRVLNRIGLGSDVGSEEQARERITRLKLVSTEVRQLAKRLGIETDGKQPLELLGAIEETVSGVQTSGDQFAALQARNLGLEAEVASLKGRLTAIESLPTPQPAPHVGTRADIPGWSDAEIAALAGRLADPSVLRLILGREPTREDLLAIALRALAERLRT